MHAIFQPSDLCSQCQAVLAAVNTTLTALIENSNMLCSVDMLCSVHKGQNPHVAIAANTKLRLCCASDTVHLLLLLTSRLHVLQVAGQILEVEDMVQTEATRKRMKHLTHLPLSGRYSV